MKLRVELSSTVARRIAKLRNVKVRNACLAMDTHFEVSDMSPAHWYDSFTHDAYALDAFLAIVRQRNDDTFLIEISKKWKLPIKKTVTFKIHLPETCGVLAQLDPMERRDMLHAYLCFPIFWAWYYSGPHHRQYLHDALAQLKHGVIGDNYYAITVALAWKKPIEETA